MTAFRLIPVCQSISELTIFKHQIENELVQFNKNIFYMNSSSLILHAGELQVKINNEPLYFYQAKVSSLHL